ncbi:MAG TPA: hypothetical protein V6D29_11670 [Leptolyngbyaceae cyanobacterium]
MYEQYKRLLMAAFVYKYGSGNGVSEFHDGTSFSFHIEHPSVEQWISGRQILNQMSQDQIEVLEKDCETFKALFGDFDPADVSLEMTLRNASVSISLVIKKP